MPSVIDIEELVISACLNDSDRNLPILASELGSDKFGLPINRAIYEEIINLWISKSPIDTVTVAGRLAYVKGIEAHLSRLSNKFKEMEIDSDYALEMWAEWVDTAGRARHLFSTLNETQQVMEDFDKFVLSVGSFDQFVADLAGRVQKAVEGGKTDYSTAHEAVSELRRRVDAELRGEATSVIDCGMPTLQRHGLFPQGLTILSGLTSIGKTSLALQVALGVALKLKENSLPGCVTFQELEMKKWRLVQRMASMLTNVNYREIESGKIRRGNTKLDRFMEAIDFIETLPLYVNDSDQQTSAGAISANVTMNLRDGPVRLTVSDYLELFVDKGDSEELRVSRIAKNHHALSKRIDTVVILISQLNNTVMQTQSKLGGAGRLRYSGAIGHTADCICEVFNPVAMRRSGIEYELPRDMGITDEDKAFLVIEKNREGLTGVLSMNWLPEQTSFQDLSLAARLSNGDRIFDTGLFYRDSQDDF